MENDAMTEQELEKALRTAAEADVAVIFAGLPEIFESEGYDRTSMKLPKCQDRLIEEVLKVQPNVVVVLHNGSPVELPWADRVSAILEMYLGGQGVGEACDWLLFGEANPSGRLAETFPYRLEDNPSFLHFQEMKSGCYMARISLSDIVIMIQRKFRCGMHSDMGCLTRNLLMGI